MRPSPLEKLFVNPRAVRTADEFGFGLAIDSLTAQRLHGFQSSRSPGWQETSESGNGHRADDDCKEIATSTVSGKLAELVETHEDFLAARQLGEDANDSIPEIQRGKPKAETRERTNETDQQTLDAKTCRDM
jgi:hypothetical protein